jgi:hypothetical protein
MKKNYLLNNLKSINLNLLFKTKRISLILSLMTSFLFLVSCGPSVCECEEILGKSIEENFTYGGQLYLTSGQAAADKWNDKVDAAVVKMLGKEDNPYTGVNEIAQNTKWTENRIIKAYNKAKQECNSESEDIKSTNLKTNDIEYSKDTLVLEEPDEPLVAEEPDNINSADLEERDNPNEVNFEKKFLSTHFVDDLDGWTNLREIPKGNIIKRLYNKSECQVLRNENGWMLVELKNGEK